MGTNYYWYPEPVCERCGRVDDPIHIGKSSGGWCFALHIDPDAGTNTLEDWVEWWNKDESFILNEYGELITPTEMFKKVTERSWNPSKKVNANWYQMNQAEPGPNGLARAKIDGKHCIGHGEGTWDYIIGKFS